MFYKNCRCLIMRTLKIFTFILILSLTVGLLACSDEGKEDATDENQDQEQMQDEGKDPAQQGQGGNQQQMQQGQQGQQGQQAQQKVEPATKKQLVSFLNSFLDWMKSDQYVKSMKKMYPSSPEEQQQAMNARNEMNQKVMNIVKESGFENQRQVQVTLQKFQGDEDIKKLNQELRELDSTHRMMMNKYVQEQQQKMQQQQQQQQKQEKSEENK